jgi:hypothetical protein
VSLHVKNGGNDDTSHTSTITQATFNSYAVGQATFNSDVAGFEALAQAFRQQRNPAPLSPVLEEALHRHKVERQRHN